MTARHRSMGCKTRPGRPPTLSAEERRTRILDAIEVVFDQAGMKGVTMATIAREAGMSKRTLYQHFQDRTQLFLAYFDRIRPKFFDPLFDQNSLLPLRARLERLLVSGSHDHRFALSLAILRAIIAETGERPEIGQQLLKISVYQARRLVRAELDRAVSDHEIPQIDTALATDLLIDMVRPSLIQVLLDPSTYPTADALQQRFDFGLTLFLKGIGARDIEGTE